MEHICSRHNEPLSFKAINAKPLEWIDNYYLNYHMFNFSEDLEKHQQISILRDTFDAINSEIWPLRFIPNKEPVGDHNQLEKIYFVKEDGFVWIDGQRSFKSPFSFKTNPGTLGVQYPKSSFKHSMSCFISDALFLETKATSGYSLPFILQHEILHMFLDHTNAPGDIMNPVYKIGNTFTQDSRDGLMSVLGGARIAALDTTMSSKWIRDKCESEKPAEINGKDDLSKNKGCLPGSFIGNYLF